ncbi:hypothetical protein XELAEV_18032222mg [Xenopus laevis]|uniref:Uncharacterized protein n=1 Tax=Xenopus laevis TaxID=8355 RepID=A0A974CP45_XENLA|nr:hypothetical protein XELAEV_18032222mg [Xenopus laevis]
MSIKMVIVYSIWANSCSQISSMMVLLTANPARQAEGLFICLFRYLFQLLCHILHTRISILYPLIPFSIWRLSLFSFLNQFFNYFLKNKKKVLQSCSA